MNQNLIEAMTSIERARSLLFAYEKVFLDLDVEPWSRERTDMAVSTFYAIWEAVDRAANHCICWTATAVSWMLSAP